MTDDYNQKTAERWYDRKTKMMEDWLGPEHDHVMHSIIPYAVGGELDLYYFPNGASGTAIATKELCEIPGEGSSNNAFESYELVMFTRQDLSLDDAHDRATSFGRMHQRINAILNAIAPYSEQATLNPLETCEFPEEMPTIGGGCLLFDALGPRTNKPAEFGLLMLVEVFRSEMKLARHEGAAKLIGQLQNAGYYPDSDMDREAVA